MRPYCSASASSVVWTVSGRMLAAVFFAVLSGVSSGASAQAPVIIDSHAHVAYSGSRATDYAASIEAALRRMDRSGIRTIVVMPPPMMGGRGGTYDVEDLIAAANAHPGRILTGGGGGTLNPILHSTAADAVSTSAAAAFRSRAETIAQAGAVAYGEIAIHHLALAPMGPQHPYEAVAPDHPLLLLLADVAAEKDMPIDIHLDPVPHDMPLPQRPLLGSNNPPMLTANVAAFERLLAHNERARIVWAHAGSDPLGTRTPALQRDLLSRHSNLFMSLRLPRGAPAPVFALTPQGRLKPEWIALITEFSDRFVIGSDTFHGEEGAPARGPAEESLSAYASALGDLPPAVAEAVAHGNAERLYRIRTNPALAR
jgi:predicted TIM-barrel fold metal-dependent hydrolase